MSDDAYDDQDDLYDSPAKAHSSPNVALEKPHVNQISTSETKTLIPGLGLLPSITPESTVVATLVQAREPPIELCDEVSNSPPSHEDHVVLKGKQAEQDALPMLDGAFSSRTTTPVVGSSIPEEEAESTTVEVVENDILPTVVSEIMLEQPIMEEHTELTTVENLEQGTDQTSAILPIAQETVTDTEFIEAAVANHGNDQAEWEHDSSPAESSDSSDSSDSDSDESDDVDYELLGPEEQARILMQGDGGSDDEGGNKKGAVGVQPRTANEKPEEKIPKPDVEITPAMRIFELGLVENIVESYVLIKGTLSAETRVLESGSVLCLEDRKVIGAVMEPLGRVEEPLYSVAFTNNAEIAEYGLQKGTKIFYVESLSTYVFTQPLKLLKGSDASNVHDEEVDDDEIEFSDDEAEAEYKRKKKLEKLARKGMRPFPEPTDAGTTGKFLHPSSAAQAQYPSHAMNYDDDPIDDDMYTPLARPANLHEMNDTRQPLPQASTARGGSERGRGGNRGQADRGHRGANRGANRGQTDRGNRGRGGNRDGRGNQYDGRGGGDRNGRGGNRGGGSSRGYGARGNDAGRRNHDNHERSAFSPNTQTENSKSEDRLMTEASPSALPNQMANTWGSDAYQQHTHVQPFIQASPQQWGYGNMDQGFNANYHQGGYPVQPSAIPGSNIPAGAFVNPTFFQTQQPAALNLAQQQQYAQYQYQAANYYPQQQLYFNPYVQQSQAGLNAWAQQAYSRSGPQDGAAQSNTATNANAAVGAEQERPERESTPSTI